MKKVNMVAVHPIINDKIFKFHKPSIVNISFELRLVVKKNMASNITVKQIDLGLRYTSFNVWCYEKY